MTFRNKRKSDDLWAYAQKKYRLNSDQIAKAKELGMNPKKPLQDNLTYVQYSAFSEERGDF